MQPKQTSEEDIKTVISMSMNKLSVDKEINLCRYIPDINGNGHIHHFTFKKMRSKNPEELAALLNQYILQKSKPVMMPVKNRVRKHKKGAFMGGKIHLGKCELCRIIELIKQAGENKIAQKLLPYGASELLWSKKQIRHAIRNNVPIDLKLVEEYNALTSMTNNELLSF